MIFWRKSAKIKELEAEMREMRRRLGTERRRAVEESWLIVRQTVCNKIL